MSVSSWIILMMFVVANSCFATGDPTRPPDFSIRPMTKTQESLQLSMVLREGSQWRAVINEQVVGVNDTVNNAKVIRIENDQVTVVRMGKKIILKMPLADVRKGDNYDE